ncbi:(2Fe-2S)-binding protein [Priestia megaterium]
MEAIQKQGCSSVDEIKACTSASRSCGGCKPLVAEVLQHTLGADFDAAAQKKRFAAVRLCHEMKLSKKLKQRSFAYA